MVACYQVITGKTCLPCTRNFMYEEQEIVICYYLIFMILGEGDGQWFVKKLSVHWSWYLDNSGLEM
jgi:hypothetical protein